jgi:hypothetical protein
VDIEQIEGEHGNRDDNSTLEHLAGMGMEESIAGSQAKGKPTLPSQNVGGL